jgi:hypothetical protein
LALFDGLNSSIIGWLLAFVLWCNQEQMQSLVELMVVGFVSFFSAPFVLRVVWNYSKKLCLMYINL